MNPLRYISAILLTATAAIALAQDFTRPVPSPAAQRRHRPVQAVILHDTVTAPPADSVSLAGFEKPLRSVRESLFVTNSTSRPVTGVTIELSYYDMHGNLMHRAVREVTVTLPAGETRRVEFPAFDRQQLFYYHRSPLPRGASQATPFDVTARVVNSIHPHLSDQ
ncbi:MAG: FxLYD domain-containing protein [Muribaculaceae bacterium]|nr:FxLYD domain-containing protein [Muribaculaceae bacterium]